MKVRLKTGFHTALLALPLSTCMVLQAQQQQPTPPVIPAGASTASAGSTAAPQQPTGTPAPGAAAQPNPSNALATSPTYVIGPEDNISVVVWQDAKLSGSFPVRPDGMISINLLGDVQAAGKKPMELAKDLAEKLKQYVTDPTVSVTVLAVNSKKIFLIGEVGHIGPMPLTVDMTPLQAIASAGGLGPYANKNKIYIMRNVNGKMTNIHFDYKKALKGGDQGEKLLPGDTIVVP